MSVEDSGLESLRDNATLAMRMAAQLRERIIDGRIEPGAHLTEIGLSKVFGASRTPIREALALLEAEGMVELSPRRGARVSTIDPSDVADLYACRMWIYGLAANLAAANRTESDLAEFDAIHRTMTEMSPEREDFSKVSPFVDFNDLLVEVARNDILRQLLVPLRARSLRLRNQSISLSGRLETATGFYASILDSIVSRDGATAEVYLRRAIAEAGDALLRQYFKLDPSEADKLTPLRLLA